MKPVVLGGVGVATLVVGLVLGFYGFSALVDIGILMEMTLKDGGNGYDRWEKIPQALIFKVYFFNVTNPREVDQGAKPILKEVGPYHYDQYRERVEVQKHLEDDTVSFRDKILFVFNQELSGNLRDDDQVTILNMALMATSAKILEDYGEAMEMANDYLNEMIPVTEPTAFITAKVKDLLFDGFMAIDCRTEFCEGVLELIRMYVPETVREVEEGVFKFSFFHHKNGTSSYTMRIKRGVKDFSLLGRITAYNEAAAVSNWEGAECNVLNGTDSTIFKPFLTPQDDLYIFIPDICRSMFAVFERKGTAMGVPVLRYVASSTLMEYDDHPENHCFCVEGQCMPPGALDLSPCLDVPVIMTFPHFFQGDPKFLEYAQGLKPDQDKHQVFLEIEPRTGAPIRGMKRMQINMYLKQVPELDLLQNVSSGLFPVVWLEEGVILGGKNIAMVRELYIIMAVLAVVKWLLIASGLIVPIGAVYMHVHQGGSLSCAGADNKVTTSGRMYPGLSKQSPVFSVQAHGPLAPIEGRLAPYPNTVH